MSDTLAVDYDTGSEDTQFGGYDGCSAAEPSADSDQIDRLKSRKKYKLLLSHKCYCKFN